MDSSNRAGSAASEWNRLSEPDWGVLKQLAANFVHRSDIDFDLLQPLACDDINLALAVQENESTASMTLAQGIRQLCFSILPADYVAMRQVSIEGNICDPRDVKTVHEKGYSGRLWYYVSDMNIYAPLLGQCDITYTSRVMPASGDGSSNFVLERYSPIYLYAVLKHAAVLMQDYDAQERYEKQFLDGCATANAAYQNAAFGPGMAALPVGGCSDGRRELYQRPEPE